MFKTEKRGCGPCRADKAADMRASLAAFTPGLAEAPPEHGQRAAERDAQTAPHTVPTRRRAGPWANRR
eukprot:5806050-Pyramimonas_sp.AAC.1